MESFFLLHCVLKIIIFKDYPISKLEYFPSPPLVSKSTLKANKELLIILPSIDVEFTRSPPVAQ